MGDYQHQPVLLEEVVEAPRHPARRKYLSELLAEEDTAGRFWPACRERLLVVPGQGPGGHSHRKELRIEDPRFSIVQGNLQIWNATSLNGALKTAWMASCWISGFLHRNWTIRIGVSPLCGTVH